MRNRKMQLKYKSQKIMDGSKPDDVREKHWSKIMDLPKTVPKQTLSDVFPSSSAKGKEVVETNERGGLDMLSHRRIGEKGSGKNSGTNAIMTAMSSQSDAGNVDARIRSLQSELLRLQESRKIGFRQLEVPICTVPVNVEHENFIYGMEEGVEVMKENKVPSTGVSMELDARTSSEKKAGEDEALDGRVFRVAEENKMHLSFCTQRPLHEDETEEELKQTEMDCGDVVKVYAFTGGRREEIGRGIIMGLPGSKYARKVIPKGWRAIKLTTCTPATASKICPFPAGWSEPSKNQTVAKANGRTILWPHMLLMNLLHI